MPNKTANYTQEILHEAPGRIFVRGVNWIGDAIMTTPALRHLRESFPDAEITMMARPWVAPIYEHNPDIDTLWPVDDGKSFLRAVKMVKAGRFDLGVALPNSFRSALLMKMGGVRRRTGFNRQGRSWLLNAGADFNPEWKTIHQVYHYLFLLDPVCGRPRHTPKLFLQAGELEREEAKRLFMQRGLDRGQPIVGVAPGSINSIAKRWPAERFAAVIDKIYEASKAGIILMGSPREAGVIDTVTNLCNSPVHAITGKLSLGQSLAVYERLTAFVGNDAGGMHIAAAMNVPTVGVFGPTRWIETGPFSNMAVIVREDVKCSPCMLRECPLTDHEHHQCMTRVTVDRVMNELKKLMKKLGRDELML